MKMTKNNARAGLFWKRAAVAARLAALFLLVYPLCNWLTSLRHNVPSFYFSWEKEIPFVPEMILPYLSIDLFFLLAPFFIPTAAALQVFARRVTAAILLCAACFLLFPLRAAFTPPPDAGIVGTVYSAFLGLDLRFNECPSLHIALLVLIADVFLRRTRSIAYVALACWFFLIGVSPVLVYQHHVIDIVCGFWLGAACLHFIREMPVRLPMVPNYRVARLYAMGAGLLAGLAISFSGAMLLLLWPAMSLGCAAAAYSGLGPGIYGKRDGRLPWTAWVVLGPLLLGQRVSLWYYARQSAPFDQLSEHVYIGRHLSSNEARGLKKLGVTAVLDLTCEFSECAALRALAYESLPILDLAAPTAGQMAHAIAFVRAHAQTGAVYIHCKAGYSRTAAVAGAWLIAAGEVSGAEEAITRLHAAREGMVIRPEAQRALREFAAARGEPAAK